MTPGEIRLVWFPFSRTEAQPWKKRPTLVLGALGAVPDRAVFVAMITSNPRRVKNPGPGDVVIDDWQKCGLRLPSVVRSRRLFTAEERDFEGTVLGRVGQQTLEQVRVEVARLMQIRTRQP